jgi:menaquinone-dependent protoporphyrinogen oxidase
MSSSQKSAQPTPGGSRYEEALQAYLTSELHLRAQSRPLRARPVRVLVAVASKHGATDEIAHAIADILGRRGLDVTVSAVDQPSDPHAFDAFVIGSAVYAGHWLKAARTFVEAHQQILAQRPVWLFSSGPIGDPPKPTEEPVDVTGLVEATAAVEHRVFAGRLERARLGFAEKAIVLALRAPDGDQRDWNSIHEWAAGIADHLHAQDTAAAAGQTAPRR